MNPDILEILEALVAKVEELESIILTVGEQFLNQRSQIELLIQDQAALAVKQRPYDLGKTVNLHDYFSEQELHKNVDDRRLDK